MTIEQTRQLGIEFERRVQTIYPLETIKDKLDTDTIYSYLSEYQLRYVRDLYLADSQNSQIERNTRSSKKLNDTLKTLIRHKTLPPCRRNIDSDRDTTVFHIPEDYFLYVRSNSIINKNYKQKDKLTTSVFTPNKAIKEDDVEFVTGAYYDKRRIIRNPLILFESVDREHPYIKLIHDDYTNVVGLDLVYLGQPYAFNVLNYNNDDMSYGAVHNYCELPFSCFNELVEGAVQMFITNYKFMLNMSSNGTQRNAQNKQDEDNQ